MGRHARGPYRGRGMGRCGWAGPPSPATYGRPDSLIRNEPPGRGERVHDTSVPDREEGRPVLRAEFAAAVRSGRAGELDARRGLRLQELTDAALR
ncbi:hypothetical protein PV392_01955 [Streptomyces sp. ME03-5709C]|nr:hypothetical protein [Streptomyces sp. ME03-5709C]